MDVVQFALNDPKTALATAGATLMTGVGHAASVIPDDIGKIATVFGIVLTSILCYTHLRKGTADRANIAAEEEVHQLEAKLLRKKLAERS